MVDILFAPTEEDIEEMCAACTQLHRALEETRMLGKKFKRRTVLLKALYKLVDAGSDPLSLKLAKLILAVSLSFLLLANCPASVPCQIICLYILQKDGKIWCVCSDSWKN